jgi:ATP-dependent Clp protease adapter protein ClpS
MVIPGSTHPPLLGNAPEPMTGLRRRTEDGDPLAVLRCSKCPKEEVFIRGMCRICYIRSWLHAVRAMPDHAVRPEVQVKGQVHSSPLYRVLLHHDGLLLARYVVQVLQEVFYFNQHDAEELALEAQLKGLALCTIEAFEQAKCHTEKLASAKLTATIEPER